MYLWEFEEGWAWQKWMAAFCWASEEALCVEISEETQMVFEVICEYHWKLTARVCSIGMYTMMWRQVSTLEQKSTYFQVLYSTAISRKQESEKRAPACLVPKLMMNGLCGQLIQRPIEEKLDRLQQMLNLEVLQDHTFSSLTWTGNRVSWKDILETTRN